MEINGLIKILILDVDLTVSIGTHVMSESLLSVGDSVQLLRKVLVNCKIDE